MKRPQFDFQQPNWRYNRKGVGILGILTLGLVILIVILGITGFLLVLAVVVPLLILIFWLRRFLLPKIGLTSPARDSSGSDTFETERPHRVKNAEWREKDDPS